jgi:hypothetical protein
MGFSSMICTTEEKEPIGIKGDSEERFRAYESNSRDKRSPQRIVEIFPR